MYKKIMIIVMSCLLFISTHTAAFATDIGALPVSQKIEATQQADRLATKADIVEALSVLMDDESQIYISPSNENITIKAFLEVFTELRNYCKVVEQKLVYPMGNSNVWLSEQEWAELMNNRYHPISLDTVNNIVNKTIDCDEFVKAHNIPDTYESYEDTINSFYGNFLICYKQINQQQNIG